PRWWGGWAGRCTPPLGDAGWRNTLRYSALHAIRIYKFLAAVALRIKQRGEIAMIDASGGGLFYRRFAVVGDAEACRLDHRDVIGAVADGKRIGSAEPE